MKVRILAAALAALAVGGAEVAKAAPTAELRRFDHSIVSAEGQVGETYVSVSGFDEKFGPQTGDWDTRDQNTWFSVMQFTCDTATDERVVRDFGLNLAGARYAVTPAEVAYPDEAVFDLTFDRLLAREERRDGCDFNEAVPRVRWLPDTGPVHVRARVKANPLTSFDPALDSLGPGAIGPSFASLNDRCDLRAGPGLHGVRYGSVTFELDGDLPLLDGVELADLSGTYPTAHIMRFRGSYVQARGVEAPVVCPAPARKAAKRRAARRTAKKGRRR